MLIAVAALAGTLRGVMGAQEADIAFSISMNLTGWSPQVLQSKWDMNLDTGALTFRNQSFPVDEVELVRAVGNGFGLYGSVENVPVNTTWFRSWWGTSNAASKRWEWLNNPVPASGLLAMFEKDGASSWRMTLANVSDSSSSVTIDHVNLQIPVKTKAPNEEALRSQAQTMSTVQDGKARLKSFSLRDFASEDYLLSITDQTIDKFATKPPQHHDVVNNSVALSFYTELVYNVPYQTSLINITGPVFNGSDAGCYAILHPEPWWWSPEMVPRSNPGKPEYRAGQTLFMLPTDPSETYQLVIGARGNDTICAISDITTYAYDPEAAAKSDDSTTSTNSASSTGAAGSDGKPASKKSNAGAIAGGVVGGVVGLALLGLALVLCLRRRRRQNASSPTSEKPVNRRGKYEPTEDVQFIVPFVGAKASDGASTPERPGHQRHYTSTTDSAEGYTPTTEKQQELRSSYDDTFFGEASTTAGQPQPNTDSNSRRPAATPRHPVHAEDMEDADEVSMLPPMYKESWSQRHIATDAEDTAVGVVRQEASGGSASRARDGLSPITTSKECSSIVSDLKSGVPLVATSRDGHSPVTPSKDGHSPVSTDKSALSPK